MALRCSRHCGLILASFVLAFASVCALEDEYHACGDIPALQHTHDNRAESILTASLEGVITDGVYDEAELLPRAALCPI